MKKAIAWDVTKPEPLTEMELLFMRAIVTVATKVAEMGLNFLPVP